MSWAIWITGPPASGKSVLARGAAAALRARGQRVTLLELDAVRKVITPEPTYGAHERDVVYRALVYMAAELTAAGVPVLVDATAHRREWRDLARTVIPRFAEVQLTCPIEVCRERERARSDGSAPRHVYARAGQPGATLPDVDVAYEGAEAPELTVDTTTKSTESSVARIVGLADRLAASSRDVPVPGAVPPEGWVLWLTGLPGSGKTTIATAVARALTARGIAARVIDLASVRRFTHECDAGSPCEVDVAHRALVYTAKLLAEAGVPVLVDATAPRRSWREIARDLIDRYAEVQLVCPREVCHTRERAARWRLAEMPWLDHRAPCASADPDIVLDYEPALNPDLTVYTDVQTPSTVVEHVLALACRVGACAGESGESGERGAHAQDVTPPPCSPARR